MPPCVLAVASLGRPAHRRFSAPPDVQELLQMGSFSTAPRTHRCACGALQSVAVTPHPSVVTRHTSPPAELPVVIAVEVREGY